MKSCPSCHAETDDQARFCLECGHAFEGAAAEPADPWQGRMVAGRFRIIRKLGDGGMGEVFLAEQVPMGRSVALKVLRQSLSDDPEQVARFKREAQAASQLQHPNTIIVHDFGQDDDGTLFIAMEFLEGQPLDRILEAEGTLEPERAARIMAQVCASLNEAHARGMVHRDLKPENIFLVDRGTPDFVKVLDFGIAKVTQSSKGEKLESITRAGAVFGTPHYMAPEQIKGEELDARADVYALGVVLYRMIAGHLPFEASTVMEMLTKHLTAEPAPIERDGGRGDPAARARLEAVALRALCKQPDQRQPSALAFAEDIMAALPGITFNSITGLTPLAPATGVRGVVVPDVVVPDAAPDAPEASSGGKGGLIALLVLLLAGGAAAGWWFFLRGPVDGGGAPAVLAQNAEGGGDEGGEGEGEGEGEKPAEQPADPAQNAAAGGAEPAEQPAEGAGGEVAEGEVVVEDEDAGAAAEGAAGAALDPAEAKRVAEEAAAEEARAAEEQAAAEAEKARVAAEERARAAAAEKQAADAAKAKADAEKAAAEAAAAKAAAEKAAAEEAAAEAKAREINAAAGRKQAEAAAARARAARLKAEAAAARARAEAERLKVELARLEAAKLAAEQARRAAEAEREAAEAKVVAAETKKAEAAEKKAAADKGRRAAGFGFVRVKTRSGGVKVKIDGRAVAVTPSAPIKVPPGRHTIEVSKDGKVQRKTVTVGAGRTTRLSFGL